VPVSGKDVTQRMDRRDAGSKAEFRGPVRGRRIDQKQARMKIAARRRPKPAVAAPALGLRRGDNPKPSNIARPGKRQGFVVGRSELVMLDQTECFLLGRFSETKQGKTTIS
jgi:hypothetical protein